MGSAGAAQTDADRARAERVIEAVWRIEQARLVAGLARMTGGDLGRAEDLAQDALLAALERWPGDGVPDNPGAWLVATEEPADRPDPPRPHPREPVLLLDQDRSRWDPLLIVRGHRALAWAEELPRPLGPYGIQAAIGAPHGAARSAEETDWVRIAALCGALASIAPSPWVELNRAVAIGVAFGPGRGLAVVDAAAAEPALAGYRLLPSVRGDLLRRAGREEAARAEFRRAAGLAGNEAERELLLRRACG